MSDQHGDQRVTKGWTLGDKLDNGLAIGLVKGKGEESIKERARAGR